MTNSREKEMTSPPDLLGVLARHIGAESGIRIDQLAADVGCSERVIRKLVSALRREGYAVCAHPTQGYYIANGPAELDRTCSFLRQRALHSLVLESRLRKISLPELLGQLTLPT